MSLEDIIRDAAKRGQLNHLSIIAHTERGGALTYRASFRDTKRDGVRSGEDADPVTAISKAMGIKSGGSMSDSAP